MCGLSTTYTQTGGFRMTVHELSRDQLVELKQGYLEEYLRHYADPINDGIGWAALINADEVVSDDVIFEVYAETVFTDDDFFCSAN